MLRPISKTCLPECVYTLCSSLKSGKFKLPSVPFGACSTYILCLPCRHLEIFFHAAFSTGNCDLEFVWKSESKAFLNLFSHWFWFLHCEILEEVTYYSFFSVSILNFINSSEIIRIPNGRVFSPAIGCSARGLQSRIWSPFGNGRLKVSRECSWKRTKVFW